MGAQRPAAVAASCCVQLRLRGASAIRVGGFLRIDCAEGLRRSVSIIPGTAIRWATTASGRDRGLGRSIRQAVNQLREQTGVTKSR